MCVLWNRISPDISINKDVTTVSDLGTTKWEFLSPESVLVAQSCLTLCDPMDHSPPGSSGHRILQARTLEWVAISFSRASSQARDQTWVSHIAGRLFTIWATRGAPMGTKDVIKSRSRIPAPGNWDADEWNDFSEPRCLRLPIYRRALNALTWDIWFSIINNHLWHSDRLPVVANFYITWLLPPAPWSSSLGATWDVASGAWSPKNAHRIKHLSTFRLWLNFSVGSSVSWLWWWFHRCSMVVVV